jgi:glycosyltransferase involved in cell wall biosynthesis
LACSSSTDFYKFSKDYNFKPIVIDITRKISPFKDIVTLIQLSNAIDKYKIDVIVGHTPKAALLAMIIGSIKKVKKRIYFKHGLLFETQTGLKKQIFIYLEKLTEYFSTNVICVSDSLINMSINYKLGNPLKYHLLNKGTCNGIDFLNKFNKDFINDNILNEIKNKYHLNNYNFIVGYVGRLANDKGINELIDAWKILEENHPNMLLLLVGPIDQRDPIDINKFNSLKNYIRFDFVNNPELFYCLMDIFILPSYREGFPTVNLEASAMKLPVITTKSTGCVDSIIPDVTGIITSINPSAISNSILYYYNNTDLIKIHGENGRKFIIDNFHQEKIWKSLSSIYFDN